jgi:hypothetical protein
MFSFTPPANVVPAYYIPSYGIGSGTMSAYMVSGLSSNTPYSITLVAVNGTGTSTPSSPVSVLTLPGAPTSLVYNSATINSAIISFTAPSGTGSITSYTPSSGNGSGSASAYTISGLSSNTPYSITLIANNSSGSSIASSVISLLTVPDAPTIGTVTVSGSTATIPFTESSGTGIITNYTVTSNIGGYTGTGTSPITILGLTPGSYTFTMTATNATGTSIASSVSNGITAVSPTVWVAVGAGTGTVGTSIVWSNNPTTTWNFATITPSTFPIAGEWVHSVDYNPNANTFIAASITTTSCYKSTDGMNWTQSTMPGGGYRIRYFSSPNLWVVLSGGTSYYVSSNNGVTWTSYITAIKSVYDIDYDGTRWIMVGGGNSQGLPIMTTTTTITDQNSWSTMLSMWSGTQVATTLANYIIYAIKYAAGTWIAFCVSQPVGATQMYSDDGVNWYRSTTQVAATSNGDASYDAANNRFIITYRPGVATSSDRGRTWTLLSPNPFTRWVYSARYYDNTWVAGGDKNTPGSLMTSTDAITWTNQLYPTLGVVFGIAHS